MDFSQLDKHIETLKNCQYIQDANAVKIICDMAKSLLSKEENVIYLSAPITICGDLHGQFYDLKEVFKNGGEVSENTYLFLGDFVDRGYHSLETFLLLLCYKVRYPQKITLLRGNHESRQITQVYGFYDESLRKYGSAEVWKICNEIFDLLPLAAVINNKIFCVHGGLSPSALSINDIKNINRKQEIPHDGPMCELLWSDPDDISDWESNPRGAGVIFGSGLVDKFLQMNNMNFVVRAHQLIMEGYKIHFNGKLFTVWSAPNYCYRCNNLASIMKLDASLKYDFHTFKAAQEDYGPAPKKKELPDYFL
jgi:serine/threonine-protein phosphatase 4 catalytic subunit